MEASYRGLRDIDHFFAEGMRGHIRSNQLRLDEADEHFAKAQAGANDEPETIPSLIRAFMVGNYIFDNALLRGGGTLDGDIPDVWIPSISEKIAEEYPEVKLVIYMRRTTEGIFRLYLGQSELAIKIFSDLIEDYQDAPGGARFVYYMGLAASYHNIGLKDAARRYKESAALMLQHGFRRLNEVRAAAWLVSYCSFLGDLDEAEDWRLFLERLECPLATKMAFLKRGEIMVTRCHEREHMLLI